MKTVLNLIDGHRKLNSELNSAAYVRFKLTDTEDLALAIHLMERFQRSTFTTLNTQIFSSLDIRFRSPKASETTDMFLKDLYLRAYNDQKFCKQLVSLSASAKEFEESVDEKGDEEESIDDEEESVGDEEESFDKSGDEPSTKKRSWFHDKDSDRTGTAQKKVKTN